MKNTQKGFIMPVILILVALLVIGGGAYMYTQNKQGNQPEAVSQTTDTTSTVQTANLKTYTNSAFGFSVKLPTNNNVYTCEDTSSRPTVANEKSYRVFILENPSDIDLMKSCDYSERAKYNNLYISASRSTPGAYSDLVANWKKGYGDGKYVTLEQTTFAGHEALIKTKVEGPNNDNLYKEVVVNGGTYSYDLSFAKKSDSLEKILATFQVIAVKDTLSDWQTLKSNDLGIEIKFPNDYRSNTVNSKLVAASDLTIYPVPQPIEFGPRLVVSRNSDHITANTNVDTWVDNIFSTDKSKSVKERGYTTINGTKWVKVKYLDVSGAGPEMTYVNYFVIKNGYMYTINYNETSQINTDNFEKIVGTITFL